MKLKESWQMNNMSEIVIKIKKNSSTFNNIENFYNYFNGFDLSIVEDADNYILRICKSDFCYCEDMHKQLKKLGIQQKDINDFFIADNQLSFCFSESWISFLWYSFCSKNNYYPKKLTILHIDDHSDLMSPFLSHNGDSYTDMLTGKSVDFDEISSLMCAVESGAITIGSCLTPIVYNTEIIKIVHIKQNITTSKDRIVKDTFHDDIPSISGDNRICISFGNEPLDNENQYIRTSSLNRAKNEINSGEEVFVHIDMDYFNNRYNASTSWEYELNRHDPDIELQKIKITELCDFLEDINSRVSIMHVAIGISPSFYPCEFWIVGMSFLLEKLKKIGIYSDEISSIFKERPIYE